MKKRIFAIVLCLFVLVGTLIVPAAAESMLEEEPNMLTYSFLMRRLGKRSELNFIYKSTNGAIHFQFKPEFAGSTFSFWLGSFAELLSDFKTESGRQGSLYGYVTFAGDFGNGTLKVGASAASAQPISVNNFAFVDNIDGGTLIYYTVTLDDAASFTWNCPYIGNNDVIDANMISASNWPAFADYTKIPDYSYMYGYDAGYSAGFNAGQAAGSDDAYNNGYNAGFAAGSAGSSDSYQEGYDHGFEQGRLQGLAEGYFDGYEQGKLDAESQYDFLNNNVFKNAVYTLYYTTDSTGTSDYQSRVITPSFPMGGVVFDVGKIFHDMFYDEREQAYVEDRIDHYYIEISWSDSDVLDIRSNTIYVSGSAPMATGHFYTIDGKSYVSDQMTTTNGDILTPEGITATTCYVNRIEISYGGFQVGRDRVHELYCSNVVYNDGYANGYAAAMNTEGAKFTESAYNSGYELGFLNGKVEGQHIAETGTFTSLLTSVVEAPINAFQSLFSFEILGMDMRVFVGSLFTLCILLIVIKVVI